jgi:hypothetical protein
VYTSERFSTSPRFVCSFTTSPTRIHAIEPVLNRLLSQTYPCDSIHINIPRRFARTGESYTLPAFLNHPKIKLNWFDTDDGPIMKVAGTVRTIPQNEDVWIVYMDDDILYPEKMLEYYAKYISKNKKQVYAPCGFTYHPDKVYEWGTYSKIGVPEGYGSVCAHRSFFGPDFLEYVSTVTKNKDCRLSDDMVMGWYFEKSRIPIRQLYESDFNDKFILKHCVMDHGNQEDAIHNGASGTFQEQGHADKYKRARAFLIQL